MHWLFLFHVQTDRVGGKQYFLDGCKKIQWGRVVDAVYFSSISIKIFFSYLHRHICKRDIKKGTISISSKRIDKCPTGHPWVEVFWQIPHHRNRQDDRRPTNAQEGDGTLGIDWAISLSGHHVRPQLWLRRTWLNLIWALSNGHHIQYLQLCPTLNSLLYS